MPVLDGANGAFLAELASLVAAGIVGRGTDGVHRFVELAFGRAAGIVAADAGVAFFTLFSLMIAAERSGFGVEAERRFRLQDGVDRPTTAGREVAIAGLQAAYRIRVHDVRSALPGFGRAFALRYRGGVLWA